MATISDKLRDLRYDDAREYVRGVTSAAANLMDEMEKALEDIATSDDIDNALDPERNKRVAQHYLTRFREVG